MAIEESGKRRETPQRQAVADYKTILKTIIDRRPSGLRGRLAEAMGKNRSFISQIVNPVYDTPIPARHLDTIFRIGHVSAEERALFLEAYERAHPDRLQASDRGKATRKVTIELPDLGDEASNRKLDKQVRDLAAFLGGMLTDNDGSD